MQGTVLAGEESTEYKTTFDNVCTFLVKRKLVTI